jgi:ubiquinone/menaquinone biosynthesis C-methylase UbiE
MTQNETINSFVEYESEKRRIIEPAYRHAITDANLRKALDTYKPSVVVKAGVGAGELLLTIAEKAGSCVCVEPSMKAIEMFKAKYAGDQRLAKIQLVNGHFFALPIDYYKADMFVCVDYFDFILSSYAMEEFKRATQFEGLYFFGGVVLNDGDVEGLYDDLIRKMNPLHNDYYLAGDFKTYMHLKDYTALSDGVETFRLDLGEFEKYWADAPFNEKKPDRKEIESFIAENKQTLTELYALDGDNRINELYCTALYRKNRYQETPATL